MFFSMVELDAWEHAYLGEHDLWGEESHVCRELTERAFDIGESNPSAAEAGFAWAMEISLLASRDRQGVAIGHDEAEIAYHRAICAGSWPAMIRYAKLLAKRGDAGRCESVLRDGVELDFVPAFFWLAWHHYKWSPTRATARDIATARDMMCLVMPMARRFLGSLMLRGKFDLRDIPRRLTRS